MGSVHPYSTPAYLGQAHDLAPLVVDFDAVDVSILLLTQLLLAQLNTQKLLQGKAKQQLGTCTAAAPQKPLYTVRCGMRFSPCTALAFCASAGVSCRNQPAASMKASLHASNCYSCQAVGTAATVLFCSCRRCCWWCISHQPAGRAKGWPTGCMAPSCV